MFRGCCGGGKRSKDTKDDPKTKASLLSLDIIEDSSSLAHNAAIPLVKKSNASSVNDVRSNDNNTVLVQFQEDVIASAETRPFDSGGQLGVDQPIPIGNINSTHSSPIAIGDPNINVRISNQDPSLSVGDFGKGVHLSNSVEQLRSCLSRRASSVASVASKKRVIYNDSAVVIGGDSSQETITLQLIKDLADWHATIDDDEVFSDSIEPQLPRGDMCTPYPKRRSSIPGMMYLPDWFANEDIR